MKIRHAHVRFCEYGHLMHTWAHDASAKELCTCVFTLVIVK